MAELVKAVILKTFFFLIISVVSVYIFFHNYFLLNLLYLSLCVIYLYTSPIIIVTVYADLTYRYLFSIIFPFLQIKSDCKKCAVATNHVFDALLL